MNIDKLTEQILEITNNSDYGWISLGSAEADRIRETLTAALTTPAVVGRNEQFTCSFDPDTTTSSATKCKCGREKWEHSKVT